jgi:hypothetical protein
VTSCWRRITEAVGFRVQTYCAVLLEREFVRERWRITHRWVAPAPSTFLIADGVGRRALAERYLFVHVEYRINEL